MFKSSKKVFLLLACLTACFCIAPQLYAQNQSTFKLFIEPSAGDAPIVNAIENAKTSVNLVVYMMNHQNVINALTSSAKKGVDVKVILEQHPYSDSTSTYDPNKIRDELEQGGVTVHWSNNKFKYTHEKAMVIDGTTAWILTFNLDDSSFTTNRDYGIRDNNKNDAKEITSVFNHDWNYKTPSLKVNHLLWSPINSKPRIEEIIEQAKYTLIIETEELPTYHSPIWFDLIDAAKRGVAIKMIMPTPSDEMGIHDLKTMNSEGVHIRTSSQYPPKPNDPLYMHAKTIIADGNIAFLGSENLTSNSLNNNRELGIELDWKYGSEEANIIRQLISSFNTDWSNATPVA